MSTQEFRQRVERLKKRRAPKRRGTQAWLAEQLGVSPRRVWGWWHGVHAVDDMAVRLIEKMESEKGPQRKAAKRERKRRS